MPVTCLKGQSDFHSFDIQQSSKICFSMKIMRFNDKRSVEKKCPAQRRCIIDFEKWPNLINEKDFGLKNSTSKTV